MKKYKQFVIGFLVGAMLFSIAPVSAAIEEFICYRADYKVMVNGSEYVNNDLPILIYKGNTYAPLKSVLEKAGLNVNWNAELKQTEVTSNPTSAQINNVEVTKMSAATKIQYDSATGLPTSAKYVEKEKNGKSYQLISYDNEVYISTADLEKYYNIENKYVDGFGVCFYKNGSQIPVDSKDKTNHFFANSRLYYKSSLFENYMGD